MELDNKINSVSSAVMGQMMSDERITKKMTPTLLNNIRNLGIGLVVGVLAFSSTGIAHASSTSKIFNTTVGLGAIAGILNSGTLPDNTPLDCAVDPKSGVPVALGTAAGALLGKQVGGGTGNKIAIVAGGLLGGVVTNAVQDASIREECMRQNAAYQNQVLETANRSAGNRIKKVSPQEVYDNTPSAKFNRNGDFSISTSITGAGAAPVNPAILSSNPAHVPAPNKVVFKNAKGEIYQENGAPISQRNAEEILNANFDESTTVVTASHTPVSTSEKLVEAPKVVYPTKLITKVPQNTVLYAFQQGKKGTVTYVTAKDSPGVASMIGKVGKQDVSTHPKLQAAMDDLNNRMVTAYANLETASNDYLAASRGVRIDEAGRLGKNVNKKYVKERVNNVNNAMNAFSESRGDFMQLADIAALEGYKLERYNQAIQFLDDSSLVNNLYLKKDVARFTKYTR